MKRECTLKKGIREGGRSDCLKVVLLVFAWDRQCCSALENTHSDMVKFFHLSSARNNCTLISVCDCCGTQVIHVKSWN